MKELKAVWLCPKCDKQYFDLDRTTFDADRSEAERVAKVAKANHKCPWELRRLTRKGGSNG